MLIVAYLVGGACEIAGILLAALELRRLVRKAQSRLGQSNPWDDHGQGAYDEIRGVAPIRVAAAVLLIAGVVINTAASLASQ